ncbi:hypothetical protein MC885_003712 [Smutsia gigantea]|nr:hypothetical protein MC885_003712 [Smutsia gigantea]
MRGAAGAGGSAGACGQGSPPRRGVPRTKPGASRGRTAGTPAAFARPARGRPRARNGLLSMGQRASVTAGPANRVEDSAGRARFQAGDSGAWCGPGLQPLRSLPPALPCRDAALRQARRYRQETAGTGVGLKAVSQVS